MLIGHAMRTYAAYYQSLKYRIVNPLEVELARAEYFDIAKGEQLERARRAMITCLVNYLLLKFLSQHPSYGQLVKHDDVIKIQKYPNFASWFPSIMNLGVRPFDLAPEPNLLAWNRIKYTEIAREILNVIRKTALVIPMDSMMYDAVCHVENLLFPALVLQPAAKQALPSTMSPCSHLALTHTYPRIRSHLFPTRLVNQSNSFRGDNDVYTLSDMARMMAGYALSIKEYLEVPGHRAGANRDQYMELWINAEIFHSMLIRLSKLPAFGPDILMSRVCLNDDMHSFIHDLNQLRIKPANFVQPYVPIEFREDLPQAEHLIELMNAFKSNALEHIKDAEEEGRNNTVRQLKCLGTVVDDIKEALESRLTLRSMPFNF